MKAYTLHNEREVKKDMKKSIKTIATIGTMTILLCGTYWLGTTQAETVTVEKEIIKRVEVVPDGYIPLEECIPLEDVACYFIDGYDYPCFELKDIGNQLDNPNNKSYADIMQGLENETEDFKNNFVDMRQVTDYTATDEGLQLYLEDGSCYFWDR